MAKQIKSILLHGHRLWPKDEAKESHREETKLCLSEASRSNVANLGFGQRTTAKKAVVKKRKVFERSEFLRFRQLYLVAATATKRSWYFCITFSKKVMRRKIAL
ncbi:MAG TPA: hypothetical protein VFT58_03890 [Nitrososphaera sp.]|nr:hypothetical protein [Nitrososphaera sp.]